MILRILAVFGISFMRVMLTLIAAVIITIIETKINPKSDGICLLTGYRCKMGDTDCKD